MMDETASFEQRNAECQYRFRIIEFLICALCLITFITLASLLTILTFVTVIILIVAIITTGIIIVSIASGIEQFKKKLSAQHARWLFIALASTIGYIICVALLLVAMPITFSWLFLFSMIGAITAAAIFLLDFVSNLRYIKNRKNKPRLNQIVPVVDPVAAQKTEEIATQSNEVCGMIECSVLVGDQLACNQQLCHVKWSSDQTSTPSAKLIYVQPCNTPAISKTCSKCKKLNCEECFQNQNNELIINPLVESKSTQFPEDQENICPLCSFQAIRVYRTTSMQTSENYVAPESVLKPIQENIMPRCMEKSSRDLNKWNQSSPVTPCTDTEQIMACPQCCRRNLFVPKQKKHLCPLCNQECTNNAICAECYSTVPAPFAEEEFKRFSSKLVFVNEMTQVSPEEFRETIAYTKSIEDKETQVSLNGSLEEKTSSKQYKYSVCCKIETEKREIETQVSFDDYLGRNSIRSEATSISEKYSNADKFYDDKSYGDRNSANNESTQVSYSDILQEEASPRKNKLTQISLHNCCQEEAKPPAKPAQSDVNEKLTQVSSSDFVQKERRPCGAANCQHPKCAKYNKPREAQEIIEMTVFPKKQMVDEAVEAKVSPIEKVCLKNHTCKDSPCTVTQYIDEETTTDLYKQSTCQTTPSLENTRPEANPIASESVIVQQDETAKSLLQVDETPRNQGLPKDLPECIDPKCTCIENEKEILLCTYCDSVLSNSMPKEVQKSGCNCGLPQCNCCKLLETGELKELPQSCLKNQDCFCIKTEHGLLKCTYCKTMIQEQQGASGGKETPVCSLSVSTCLLYKGRVQRPDQNTMSITQTENTQHSTQTKSQTKTVKSYRKDSEDEEQKNK